MRRNKLPPEARKQRRAPKKLKMMSKQAKLCLCCSSFLIFVGRGLSRKMRHKKLAPEARKQRRAPEKLKMMSKQAKHCLCWSSFLTFVVGRALSRKMRRKKLALEARKQRRAPEKLKIMSKQAKQFCFCVLTVTYLERRGAKFEPRRLENKGELLRSSKLCVNKQNIICVVHVCLFYLLPMT